MANNKTSKLKTLYIKRILEDETDSEHGITMPELINRLAEYGIDAERKSVYKDIELLRDFGVDIKTYRRRTVEYAIDHREFALSELTLLIDAVESCKSLTQRQADSLITNLKLMASDPQREKLNRNIHVAGRITSTSDSVFLNIDMIHQAIRDKKKVRFQYLRHNLDGERVASHDGKLYEVSPVAIAYSEGFYYMSAYSDELEAIVEYRIDRMGSLEILDDPACKNELVNGYKYELDDYEYFSRFDGDPVTVTLLVDIGKIEIVIDRFGGKAELFKVDERTAKAIVKVRKSEPFFGWIAGLGGHVRIDAPQSLKQEYLDYLENLIKHSSS